MWTVDSGQWRGRGGQRAEKGDGDGGRWWMGGRRQATGEVRRGRGVAISWQGVYEDRTGQGVCQRGGTHAKSVHSGVEQKEGVVRSGQ